MKRFISLILALVLALTISGAVFASAIETDTCNHEFAIAKSATTHYEECTLCGYVQNTQVHTMEMHISAVAHSNVCITCGYITESHKHVFENGACTVCGYTDELVAHSCPIVRATESYHRYECDECENYERIPHTEDSMDVFAKNEFFHTFECVDCGYEYAVRHNFRTSHDENLGHYEKCVDCGYKQATVAHIMTANFFGYYHDSECLDCTYKAARHVGVKYTPADEYNCQATCSECNVSSYVAHDWSSFVCDNCGYEKNGSTIGMLTEIDYFNDEYNIYFLTATGEEEFVTVPNWRNWDIAEGDIIRIDHEGDTIWGIELLVDCDILDDVENFENYISDFITEKNENLLFDNLVTECIEYNENYIHVRFNDGVRGITMDYTTDYVVFDITEGEISDLEEDCAYLIYLTEEMVYFICFW